MQDPDEHVYRPPGIPRDPDRPAYSKEGVDLTLIRAMLARAPLERLRELQESVNSIDRLLSRSSGWTTKPS